MKTLKHAGFLVSISFLLLGGVQPVLANGISGWKGTPPSTQFSVGGLTGLGIVGGSASYGLVGTVGKKILNEGFIEDIADTVWAEVAVGPKFPFAGGAAFFFSAHLQWQFHLNDLWAFYGLGGFGGHLLNKAAGDRALFFPRIGLGALHSVNENIKVRAEVSHEFMSLGVVFEI